MTETIERPLPYNIEAERSILGAIQLDNLALNTAVQILRPEDFFLSQHRHIFECMIALGEKRHGIDTITLMEHLSSSGRLEAAGGIPFLSQLADGMPRVSNIEHYVRIVKEKAILRSLIHKTAAIQESAFDSKEEAPIRILERAEQMFAQVRHEISETEHDRLRSVRSLSDILSIEDFPDQKDEWIVDRFILRGGTTMISAPPSKYKSWLSLLLCKSSLTEEKFLGRFKASRHRILYLDRENRPGRIKARAITIGLNTRDPFLSYWSKIQAPPKLGDPRLVEIAREFRPLFIFDTLIRFGNVSDENSASEMSRLLEAADVLTQFGSSNLILHHPTKNGGSWFRGSGDLEAFIDIGFSVAETEEGSGRFLLKSEKSRDDEGFQLTFEARPALDDIGDFRVIDAPAQSRDEADAEKLLSLITKSPGLTRDKITTAKVVPEKRARVLLDRYANRKWRVEFGLYNAATYFPT